MITPQDLVLLREGVPPISSGLVKDMAVGHMEAQKHLSSRCLPLYVKNVGAKVKFLVGSEGTGKSHFLSMMALAAEEGGFIVVRLSLLADQLKLNDVSSLYRLVAERVDPDRLLGGIASRIAASLGYPDLDLREDGKSLLALMQSNDGLPATEASKEIRRSIANALAGTHLPLAFKTFLFDGLHSRLMSGSSIKGGPLHRWFNGEKLTTSEKRETFIFDQITRRNALNYLYGLIAMVRLAGDAGLAILLDDGQAVLEKELPSGMKRYTKSQAWDFWELLRQLIDATERLPGLFVAVAMRREAMGSETSAGKGLMSYAALHARVQTGIAMRQAYNPYGDLLDLDAAGSTGEELVERALAALRRALDEARASQLPHPLPETISTRSALRERVSTLARCHFLPDTGKEANES